ncbi:MAG: carboxypeptidase regulatory-like domain-containing protein [Acidobacteria bacterium]|nr:carboxypeptidase regulatory-like domain-containing protein [Acidobacteriota bacterium]
MPKLFLRLACLSLLLLNANPSFAQTPTPAPQPLNCSISGRVTVAGKPLVNARVTLLEANATRPDLVANGQAGDFSVKTVTDADGRYQLRDLPQGKYAVRALSSAYVLGAAERYDPWSQQAGGRLVTLEAGEQRTEVDLEFVRGGVITGRLTDARGKPVIEEGIHLIEMRDPQRPDYAQGSSTIIGDQTDDRGVYRLFGIPAGRYAVAVGMGVVKSEHNNLEFRGRLTRALVFYPGVPSLDKAKIIAVNEGDELTGIDFKLADEAQAETVAVTGHVIEAENGKPVPKVSLLLESKESADTPRDSRIAQTDAEGEFRFTELKAGGYTLGYSQAYQTSKATAVADGFYGESLSFTVGAEAVNGLELRLQRAASVSGVVVVEGQATSGDEQLMPYGISVMPVYEELSEEERNKNRRELNYAQATLGATGQFKLTGLRPGRVQLQLVSVTDRPGRFMMRRIERNGAPVSGILEIGAAQQLTGLRISVVRGTGRLRGQVELVGALPAGYRMQVDVLAEEFKRRLNSGEETMISGGDPRQGSASVDEAGRFLIEELLPGTYELRFMAWPPPSQRDLPMLNDEMTQQVSVNAEGTTTVTVKVDFTRKRPQ